MITPVNPEKIILRCLTRRCGGNPSDDPLGTDVYPLNTTDPILPGVTVGQEVFSETCLALYAPNTFVGGTPTNLTQLQQLSEAFRGDYLNWRQTQFDESFSGIVAFAQNGLLDETVFNYQNKYCYTRINTFVSPFRMTELGHQIQNPEVACPDTSTAQVSARTPCIQVFSPPKPTQLGGSTTLDIFLICKEDGRYTTRYDTTVTYACKCGSSCTVTICVHGCQAQQYPGVTVTVYDHSGGTMLGSGVTGSNGCATISGLTAAGTYYVTVTGQSSRFQAYGQNVALNCTTPVTISLTPASGYVCLAAPGPTCLLPVAKTLTLSDSVIGSCTLTWTGTKWAGSITYNYPGFPLNNPPFCFCPPSNPVIVDYSLSTALLLIMSFIAGVPGVPGCPNSVGSFSSYPFDQITQSISESCPPSFSYTNSLTSNTNCFVGGPPPSIWALYGGPLMGTTFATISIVE